MGPLIAVIVLLGALGQAYWHSFLLFHTVAELLTVAVAGSVFLLVWNGRRLINNDALVLLAITYLCVGSIDLSHLLTYKGMDVVPVALGANLSTQFWIVARGLEALALVLFALMLGRRFKPETGLLVLVGLTVALLAMIWQTNLFPDCYIEGSGLTGFKVGSEYVICLLLTAAMGLMWYRRRYLRSDMIYLLLGATAMTIAAELAFTTYVGVYEPVNAAGHVLKVGSFGLLYLALVRGGLVEPQRHLFDELARSRDQLARAQRVAHLGHWEWESPDRFIWSDEMYRLLGVDSRNRPQLEAIRRLVHPKDRGRCDEAVATLGDGKPAPVEFRIRRVDGQLRVLQARAEVLRRDGGVLSHVVGTIQDVTEVRDTDRQLSIARTLHNLGLRIMAATAVMKDSGDIRGLLEAVQAELTTLGIAFDALGINLVDSRAGQVHVEIYNLTSQGVLKCSEEAFDVDTVAEFWRRGRLVYRRDVARDGKERMAEYQAYFGHSVRSVVDVPFAYGTLAVNSRNPNAFTDEELEWLQEAAKSLEAGFRRRADLLAVEEQRMLLHQSQQRLRVLMDNLPGMAYRRANDLQGTMEFVSGGCVELTGYSATDMIDGTRRLASLIHPEDRADVEVAIAAAVATGQPFEIEYRLCVNGGHTRWVWERGRSVQQDNGVLEGFIIDVTDAKQARQSLLQSSRLIALGEMAAGLAHELNQPLTTISVLAEGVSLRQEHGVAIDVDQLLRQNDTILASVERMSRLIEHLRLFSRDSSQQEETCVEISKVVEGALQMSRARIQHHGVDLMVNHDDTTSPVLGDHYRLEQVVMNLIQNAFEALQERSERPAAQDRWQPRIDIRTFREQDSVVLTVADNGVGMDDVARAKMLEPFFTTKGPDRGTGLGLSITAAIISDHQGRIECDTQPGAGTRMRVYLPVTNTPLP